MPCASRPQSRCWVRITFPLLAPGLVASGVYAFLQAWNEFTVALVILQDNSSQTLPLWLRGCPAVRVAGDGLGTGDGGLHAGGRARHHLLPHHPGTHDQRPGQRGGQGVRRDVGHPVRYGRGARPDRHRTASPHRGDALPGFVGTTVPAWLEERLRRSRRGVRNFGQNDVESAAQLRALTDAP